MRTKIEFCQNDEPLCPYCKKACDTDESMSSDGDLVEVQCGHCDKHFSCETIVMVKYSTLGDCEKNGEMPHELEPCWTETGPATCRKCALEVYSWEMPGGLYPKLKPEEFVMVEREKADLFT